jgi:hypothetical protein
LTNWTNNQEVPHDPDLYKTPSQEQRFSHERARLQKQPTTVFVSQNQTIGTSSTPEEIQYYEVVSNWQLALTVTTQPTQHSSTWLILKNWYTHNKYKYKYKYKYRYTSQSTP